MLWFYISHVSNKPKNICSFVFIRLQTIPGFWQIRLIFINNYIRILLLLLFWFKERFIYFIINLRSYCLLQISRTRKCNTNIRQIDSVHFYNLSINFKYIRYLFIWQSIYSIYYYRVAKCISLTIILRLNTRIPSFTSLQYFLL